MAHLDDSIKCIKGIGEKKALAFAKLGVFSLFDLITFFPKKYEDRSTFKHISLLVDGESACVCAVIADEPRMVRLRRGLDMVKFRIADESGCADVTYFNQSWMKNNINKGDECNFYGKASVSSGHVSFTNPVCESSSSPGENTGRIVPLYHLTSGISRNEISKYIRDALNLCLSEVCEIIPEPILQRRHLADRKEALLNIHHPKDFDSLAQARKRLTYEELFILSVSLSSVRKRHDTESGFILKKFGISDFYSSLPFSPTGAQFRSVEECLKDMASGKAMNRLLQGDVGSGKTLVAAALFYSVFKNGYCSAFMAPTEILAQQHYKTMCTILNRFGMKIAVLTGSTAEKDKAEIRRRLKNGEIDLIIGTHALFSEKNQYSNLALVVTDEQHRFGVDQRSAIINKGVSPHVLVMSATPIPRTLALIIFGDLDISILDEVPPGRQIIDTFAVSSAYRGRLESFILKQKNNGNQVYIVCPKIEAGEDDVSDLNLHSAEEYETELRKKYPELKTACVHGRLKPTEKESIMNAFVSGCIDVLVSTTVIEVGVDVPNATLIIIENAERFGLSQLHQLRGRVGRGREKSYCVLVSDSQNDESKARLDILCKTNDGFKISEEDLKIRGPGDFFGSRQHGLPEMHLADLGADALIMKAAQEDAADLLESDPELELAEHATIKERCRQLFASEISRMN